MHFKIDENLPIEIAEILNNAGHDAKTVHNQQLQGTKYPKNRSFSICGLLKKQKFAFVVKTTFEYS